MSKLKCCLKMTFSLEKGQYYSISVENMIKRKKDGEKIKLRAIGKSTRYCLKKSLLSFQKYFSKYVISGQLPATYVV